MGLYGGDTSSTQITMQEQKRQQDIRQGQSDIDAIFGGYKGINPISGALPKGVPLYDAAGAAVLDSSSSAPGSTFYTGRTQSGGFDDNFFNQRKQDYLNYALPQFADQYQNVLKKTSYGLSRAGLLQSGAADYLSRQLNQEKVRQTQNIANQGQEQANTLRSNVNSEKNRILGQLSATGDLASASTQSLAAASQFSQPTAFPALGNLFTNWSNLYLTRNLSDIYGGPIGNTQQPSAQVGAGLGSSFQIR